MSPVLNVMVNQKLIVFYVKKDINTIRIHKSVNLLRLKTIKLYL